MSWENGKKCHLGHAGMLMVVLFCFWNGVLFWLWGFSSSTILTNNVIGQRLGVRKMQCKSTQYLFQHPGRQNSISKRKFIMSNIRIINGLLLLKTFYMNAIKPAWYFMHGLSLVNMRWGRNFFYQKRWKTGKVIN